MTTTPAVSVVVADDDSDIRNLMMIAARKAGFELLAAASDGDEAWDAVSTLRPSLAILDVSMPGMTGIEVTRLIRASAALGSVRVVIVSAAVGAVAQAEGMDAGADLYLSKPFSPRELAARLVEVMA
jgi:DNA-binding response OmpR family regulator